MMAIAGWLAGCLYERSSVFIYGPRFEASGQNENASDANFRHRF